MNHPLNVMNTNHKMFAQFFISSHIVGKSRHWVKWNSLCLLKEVGGLGFRRVKDLSIALFCKLWWNFSTKRLI